jgi:hypothetical protein
MVFDSASVYSVISSLLLIPRAPCRDATFRSCRSQRDALGYPYSSHLYIWRSWLLGVRCRRAPERYVQLTIRAIRNPAKADHDCRSELSVPTQAQAWDSNSAHCSVHTLLPAYRMVLPANIDHCEHRPWLRAIYRTPRNNRGGATSGQIK